MTESTILLAVPFLGLITILIILSLTPAHTYDDRKKARDNKKKN